jgi:hypothetical protein
MVLQNSRSYYCVKITLIELYGLSILGSVILIAGALFGLSLIWSTKADKLTHQQKDVASMLSFIIN